MRSGKPRERKTREMPSRPACGLVASWRGRSSRTKGVLCSKGKRAAMKRYIEYLYYIVNKKDANYSTFFENPKIRRGSGSGRFQALRGAKKWGLRTRVVFSRLLDTH